MTDTTESIHYSNRRENLGLFLGLLGVTGFSVTLPATRMAVSHLDPVLVGLGRALVAAVLAGLVLFITRQPRPAAHQIKSLFMSALAVIVGFPLLSSIAMQQLPAAHAAIMIAVVPLLTAAAGALLAGERPSKSFWVFSVLGSATVMMFAVLNSGGELQRGDVLLLLAAVIVALGYAEGGRLARHMGGWQVICWALVIIAPFLLLPVGYAIYAHGLVAPWQSWAGFAYVSVVSQLIAFVLWYQGMALGGVVRVSQVQLLQPFMTLLVAALLLDESIQTSMIIFAVAVVLIVALGKRMPVTR